MSDVICAETIKFVATNPKRNKDNFFILGGVLVKK
tara:strand:- start:5896 stop:6000 length:105 start_codon:yes stop_codon:yes gene_type:complete